MSQLIYMIAIVVMAAGCKTTGSNVAIAGGESVSKSKHPAADAIQRATVQIYLEPGNPSGEACTGTLISKRLVLTAGHCIPASSS